MAGRTGGRSATPKPKGSRLSAATKASIAAAKKAGTLTGKQAKALRQTFRSPNTSEMTKAMKAAGMTQKAAYAQMNRTKRRKAAK